MLAQERQHIIMEMARERKTVQVAELTKHFNASVATIRRDLEALEKEGMVRRVYGGAVFQSPAGWVQPYFTERQNTNARIKEEIGRVAAELIVEGETILLDVGTTTLEVARHIKHFQRVTVVTNSLPIITELAETNLTVFSVGGRLRPNELCFSGDMAEENLRAFYVDKAFVGAGGITFEEGISDFSYGAAKLRRVILERAKKSILVTDSGKFGFNAFAIVGDIAKVDLVVTDQDLPAKYVEGLAGLDVDLIRVVPVVHDDESAAGTSA